ncbi:MAG: beta-lactamase family protein [Anaerolineales bacterium]|nr:beta-lactamase family protein [Anaerolineales bacterium]
MKYLKDLDVVLQEIMLRWDVPGMAIGIVKGDEVAYAKGFGVQSLETQTPVTLDTIFCVQSISKCFVATAVMQLAERGKLDLDAPIVQYLPYFLGWTMNDIGKSLFDRRSVTHPECPIWRPNMLNWSHIPNMTIRLLNAMSAA